MAHWKRDTAELQHQMVGGTRLRIGNTITWHFATARRQEFRTGMEGQQRVGPLTSIPRVLSDLGQQPTKVIRAAGITPEILSDPENKLTFPEVGRLFDSCVVATGCPHFGLLVGQHAATESLGVIGQLMRHASTLDRAILDVCVNQQRYVRGSVVYFTRQGRLAFWGYGVHHPAMQAVEHACDCATVMGSNILRELTGQSPQEVRIARRAPSDLTPYHLAFGQAPTFNADQYALVISTELLRHPVRGADPNIRDALEARVDGYWAVAQPSVAERVARVLRAHVVHGVASLGGVARELQMHPRTLNRRLEDEGTSFRKLLNIGRHEVARQLLAGTDIKVTEIALTLGYSEISTFTRAFLRSAGKSPLHWREESRRGS